MRPHEMNYNRLRASRSHTCTWVGYERIDDKQGLISAMVPRRIPNIKFSEILDKDGKNVKIPQLKSFELENYAMMLTTFDMKLEEKVLEVTDSRERDYNTYLPLDRMESFSWHNLRIVDGLNGDR